MPTRQPSQYWRNKASRTPKAKDGPVECLRILRTARSSAMKARTAAINQIKGLLVSAPDALRAKYRRMATTAMITALQRSRPSGHVADPEYMTLLTLKTLATRYQALAEEITAADTALQEILDSYAPLLCDLSGVGPDVASQLLITVGDNRGRIGNEARFAALVGVAPIPASSGKTTRHRLSRGGDRNANRALHQVVLTRMASCPGTKNYVSKRTTEGKSKREIMRCLKRYVSREIYRQIFNPIPPPSVTDLRQKRKSLRLTINAVAAELSQWPSVIPPRTRPHAQRRPRNKLPEMARGASHSKDELTTIGASLGSPENMQSEPVRPMVRRDARRSAAWGDALRRRRRVPESSLGCAERPRRRPEGEGATSCLRPSCCSLPARPPRRCAVE